MTARPINTRTGHGQGTPCPYGIAISGSTDRARPVPTVLRYREGDLSNPSARSLMPRRNGPWLAARLGDERGAEAQADVPVGGEVVEAVGYPAVASEVVP